MDLFDEDESDSEAFTGDFGHDDSAEPNPRPEDCDCSQCHDELAEIQALADESTRKPVPDPVVDTTWL